MAKRLVLAARPKCDVRVGLLSVVTAFRSSSWRWAWRLACHVSAVSFSCVDMQRRRVLLTAPTPLRTGQLWFRDGPARVTLLVIMDLPCSCFRLDRAGAVWSTE